MTTNSKILRIYNITNPRLKTLLKNIICKQGLDIKLEGDNFIVAIQQMAFLTINSLFIVFDERLSGVSDDKVETHANIIKTLANLHGCVTVLLVSKSPISNGYKEKLKKFVTSLSLEYIGRDEIIKNVDKVFPEYWRHDDEALIQYENNFKSFVEEDTNLRKLMFSNDKYREKLNFFIEPRLSRKYVDENTGTLVQKRSNVDGLIQSTESIIIDGMNGSGKSTILKRIGLKLIGHNTSIEIEKKFVPVFITAQDIFNCGADIKNLILSKTQLLVGEGTMEELSNNYDLHILIDSIDELDEKQRDILEELSHLNKKYHVKYYIATRNNEVLPQVAKSLSVFQISRFNMEQIKNFLVAFFHDEGKTSSLLDTLKENRIIERLPLTPLTLSLITILFEEKNLEIPATISDVYDNFNALILGQSVVSSRIELIDVSFRERILSVYAFLLMAERPNHEPLTENEFINHFVNFFHDKSYTIRGGSIEEALRYLIHHTGIIFLKDNKYVQFCHSSYMEYYAAREIFNHKRYKEGCIVDNFFDLSWQNVAIFYAGMSKDMPEFLNKILEKIRTASTLPQYNSVILGCGYLLQALYTTDNKIRKEVVVEALKMSLESLNIYKKIVLDNSNLQRFYKLPILTVINFLYFYECFNSITLSNPLKMAFDELYTKFEKFPINSSPIKYAGLGYSLLELAFTLDSKRINYDKALGLMLDNKLVYQDSSLTLLADLSLACLHKANYNELLTNLRKKVRNLSDVHKTLIEQPLVKLRFTSLDTINPPKKVKLIVEGKTDAIIIEHAFHVLSQGYMPYWSIDPGGPSENKSCAKGVRTTIEHCYSVTSNDEIVIGILDHDAAGLGEFNYLKNDFEEIFSGVKKHKYANIFIVILPIPGEMQNYLRKRQESNFFAIEHYFGHDYLSKNGMLKQTDIPEIFSINDKKKTTFATTICKCHNPENFKFFLDLFYMIDKITGIKIHYVY